MISNVLRYNLRYTVCIVCLQTLSVNCRRGRSYAIHGGRGNELGHLNNNEFGRTNVRRECVLTDSFGNTAVAFRSKTDF